jgi:undecaprenyl-diphosphatase
MRCSFQNFIEQDIRLSNRLRILKTGMMHKAAVFFAHSGDSWFWMAGLSLVWLSALLLQTNTWQYRSVFLAICIVVQAIFVLAIKFAIRRQRPQGEWGGIYRRRDPHSFPSGHATRAFMLAVLAIGLGPAWFGWLLVIWAPMVCLARIMLGVHYISDIVAGAALGVLMGILYLQIVPDLLVYFPFLF